MTNTPQGRREEIARRQWHDLKCIPPFFDDVASGAKPFEVRKNDRDYQEGDGLRLREWTATDGYSGRVVERFVTYVLRDAYAFGVQPGYVVLGLALSAPPLAEEAVKKALGLAMAALQTIQGMEPITHEITLPTVMAQHATDALNEIKALGATSCPNPCGECRGVAEGDRAVKDLLNTIADFLEDEADNRAAAGSEMSDYEREPRELAERVRQAISAPPAPVAGGKHPTPDAAEALAEAVVAADLAVTVMARAFERIHSMPRTSDSELAERVSKAKERLRQAASRLRSQGSE